MTMDDSLGRFQELMMPTYAPFGRGMARGEGTCLYDTGGSRYLDFCGGIAVNNVGHCHPAVVAAIREQAGRLMHISNLYLHEGELTLAAELNRRLFPGRLFLCQSGAEANETAIKLARKFHRTLRGENRFRIITALNSFHGRTLAAITATGQTKYQAGFEPLPEGFTYVPYGDLGAVAAAIDDRTSAVLMEPLLGEGGVIVPGDDFLPGLRRLCDERGILLMLDEVQTGFGRTGTLFSFQQAGIVPDVLTMAKAFGGGLPLGGVLARSEVARAFVPGNHATTFGGNPVTVAAALAVLSVIDTEKLTERCLESGERLARGLEVLAAAHPEVAVGVRGRGLLLGFELSVPAREIMLACQDEGLLLSVVQDRVLRFTPPLTVSADEIDEALAILERVLRARNVQPR